MAWDALLAGQFLVAVGLLLLGAWILRADPASRLRRAFALFLAVRAGVVLTSQLARLDGLDRDYWSDIRGYLVIGQVPALLNFMLTYLWRRRTSGPRYARWVLLAATVALELLYLGNHRHLYYFNDQGGLRWGPLGILIGGVFALSGVFAIWLARTANLTQAEGEARFHRLLALGFASLALVDGILPWVRIPTDGFGPYFAEGYTTLAAAGRVVYLAAVPAAILALVILSRGIWREPRGDERVWWVVGVGVASVLLPAATVPLTAPEPSILTFSDYAFHLLLGLSRLLFPAIVAYAISRHTLSDTDPFRLDYHAKITIQRSTIGAAFVALFFIITEGSQELLERAAMLQDVSPVWSQVLGLAGASILVLVIHPLHRVAERVSASALPKARPVGELSAQDRADLYAGQAMIAWADGTLSRKERLLLDKLRERLEVPVQDAARIESKAARAE